ncbi:hypothetical protein [Vagococcus carniphilus]|uniref:hypothetical protein n=1 Tax=Vagococcus carniphilus TaxID=218144 RepID=UPI00288E8448|nr:hypothetical protein [Vagococcus carniphilus]MDT2864685.1 hypothetical protein [Vagococcus carniphilus]
MIELDKVINDFKKGLTDVIDNLMKVDFMESLRLSKEAENEETKKVLQNLALKQFARAVEKVKEEEKTGSNLHFKDIDSDIEFPK